MRSIHLGVRTGGGPRSATLDSDFRKSKNAEEAYNAGMKLQQEKKWDEAVSPYQKEIQINGNEPAFPAALAGPH
ncbi:MAG: hypothetical protein K2Z81_11275 [Cyanobacteria bacterium]|nr:hypothetical protein [Cyanobacteriota bacterium]